MRRAQRSNLLLISVRACRLAVLALYLASPASDYVTGAVFVVDGGMNVATSM